MGLYYVISYRKADLSCNFQISSSFFFFLFCSSQKKEKKKEILNSIYNATEYSSTVKSKIYITLNNRMKKKNKIRNECIKYVLNVDVYTLIIYL